MQNGYCGKAGRTNFLASFHLLSLRFILFNFRSLLFIFFEPILVDASIGVADAVISISFSVICQCVAHDARTLKNVSG